MHLGCVGGGAWPFSLLGVVSGAGSLSKFSGGTPMEQAFRCDVRNERFAHCEGLEAIAMLWIVAGACVFSAWNVRLLLHRGSGETAGDTMRRSAWAVGDCTGCGSATAGEDCSEIFRAVSRALACRRAVAASWGPGLLASTTRGLPGSERGEASSTALGLSTLNLKGTNDVADVVLHCDASWQAQGGEECGAGVTLKR